MTPRSAGRSGSEWMLFLRQARERWHHTGAVAPSSRSLARAIVRPFASRPDRAAACVAEVGPGTGSFTREIARGMGPGDRLDVYDVNETFLEFLDARIRAEADFAAARGRIHLHHLDARHLPAEARYGYLVSGLPFNNFPPDVVRAILDAYLRAVSPGGTISFFEYALARQARRLLPGAGGASHAVDRLIRETLRCYQDRQEVVVANVPPAIVHHLRRPLDVGGAATEPAAPGGV